MKEGNGELKVVLPFADRGVILRHLNDQTGHWEQETTRDLVSAFFWLPTMRRDVASFVRSCEDCQKTRAGSEYKTKLHQPLKGLFHSWAMDFVGPFEEKNNGNRFFHVAVEHLSGWPVLLAKQNQTADLAVRIFVKSVAEYGRPKRLVTDSSPAFIARSIMTDLRRVGSR